MAGRVTVRLCAGIVVMFGSTYNGQFEDVEAVDKMIGVPSLIWLRTPLCVDPDEHAQGCITGCTPSCAWLAWLQVPCFSTDERV